MSLLKDLGKKEIQILLILNKKKICVIGKLFDMIGSKDYGSIYKLMDLGLIEVKSHVAFYPMRLVYLTEKGETLSNYLNKIAELIK